MTRKTGNRLLAALLAFSCSFPLVASSPKEKNQQAAFALIAGTAFRPPGFSLPGARVEVRPESPKNAGVKLKKLESVTDARGEFAIRVAAVPMKWTVHVKADGYSPNEKTVSIDGEQRVDVNFQLEPVNGPEGAPK